VADVLIVAYVLYRALLVLRGTRAMQMAVGLGIVFLVYLGAGFVRPRHAALACSRGCSRRSSSWSSSCSRTTSAAR
jgi:hypothetical protein